MKCGTLAEFKHVKDLQPLKGNGNALETGSIIHKFLEVYHGSQMKGIGRTQAVGFGMAAAEMYIQGCQYCYDFQPTDEQPKPSCGHQPNEYPGLKNTPAESDGYIVGWQFALQTCDEYAKFWASDFWVTLAVETVRSKTLYEDDEVSILFKSKLDWIVDTNTAILPCDHKTMKQNRDTLSMNNQFMGQCRQLDTRSVIIDKIGLQKTLKPEEKFKRVPVSYSAERLMEWQSVTLPYWTKQYIAWNRDGYFPQTFPSCNGQYGKCEFYSVCESNPSMREEELRNNFYVGVPWNPVNAED
jgi:hypothetical protein